MHTFMNLEYDKIKVKWDNSIHARLVGLFWSLRLQSTHTRVSSLVLRWICLFQTPLCPLCVRACALPLSALVWGPWGSSGSVSCVMAASVLLSAESAVPSFTVGHPAGVTAAGTTHHGLSNAPGPASWNRSLDRALDEAAATGALNLSGRKLKEFPRSAAGHDLTDTTRAGTEPIYLYSAPL